MTTTTAREADVDLEPAYAAGTAALAKHCDKYDTIREIAVTVVDAAAEALGRATRKADRKTETERALSFIHEQRATLVKALASQARYEAANGTGADKGFYDAELTRAAEWLETLLS